MNVQTSVKETREAWDTIEEIAKFFNQFASKERYGYIDRLATPYNQRIIEVTLQEALREARSAGFWLPNTTSVKNFIELCSRDLRYSTIASALALTSPKKEEKEG